LTTRDAGRRAIVLGGTGYVGRNVCDAFSAAGYEVLVIARRDRGVPPGCRMIAADLATTSVAALTKMIADAQPASVVNAAGGVWGVSKEEILATSREVTQRLLPAMIGARCRSRIIQFGSMMEYLPTPEGTSLDEHAPVGPVDTYGWAKLAASETVLRATAAGDLRGIVLRISNVAGPGAPVGSLLGRTAHQLIEAAEAGRVAEVELAPLRARRDYIDVRDVADAAVLAAQSDLTDLVLNVGRGTAVTVRSLVDLLIRVSGVPARVVERRSDPGTAAPNRTDVLWMQTDSRRAARLLGWRPRRSLEDAIGALWHDARSRSSLAHAGTSPRHRDVF
jgi:nucleoside-diphosphate-sugar epimerase